MDLSLKLGGMQTALVVADLCVSIIQTQTVFCVPVAPLMWAFLTYKSAGALS